MAAAVAVGLAAAIRSVGHADAGVNPMLLAGILYYAMHAVLSLPMPQRWLRECADQVE